MDVLLHTAIITTYNYLQNRFHEEDIRKFIHAKECKDHMCTINIDSMTGIFFSIPCNWRVNIKKVD
jgi:hypothetical protein